MADYVFTHASNTAFTTRVTLTNAGVGVVNWSATFIRSSTIWKSFNVNTSTNRPEFSFALGGVGFSGFYTYDFRDGSGQGLERAMGSGSISVPSGSTLTLTGTNDPKGSMGIATVPAGQTFTTQSAPPPATPVWSTATALAAATRGTAYSRTVVASPVTSYSLVSQSGGTGTYSVSSGGVISGTPSAVGTANVTVRANNSGSTADRTFTFTVNPALPVFTDSAVASPTIRGNAYSNGVTATEAASYSVFSGSLPAGISLNTSSGAITGTPTTVGTSTFVIRATNVTGSTNTPSRTIVVNPRTPVFSDSSVNSSARVGTPYSDAVAASEVDSYSIFSGALPVGLGLNTSTGAITGSPTTFGTYTFIIRATNVTGNTNTATLTITVTSGSKVWNGTTFVVGNTKAWNGTTFVSTTTKVWNGSAWVSST
jgi:hypothetical protein